MKKQEPSISSQQVSRRGWLAGAAGAVALGASGIVSGAQKKRNQGGPVVVNGRINQSVADWCFTGDGSVAPMSFEELAKFCAEIGVKSIELADPSNWDILKKYGLICALSNSHGFEEGFNDPNNHAMCIEEIKKSVDLTAAAGFPNVITFSGFRKNIPDDVGLDNTVEGLKKVIGYAEKKKVTLILEVLNSRVTEEMKGHPGYMGDSVEWCVEVCKRIDSERMKILFDIYHVQIMQGDVITRIRENAPYIGHYHTAGVPGRNELDNTQEINYPAIMKEIVKTGYQGYVGQEFIPTRNPKQGLRQAVRLCDV